MDTAHEIALGRGIERSIDAQTGTLGDPLLVAWVGRVFRALTAHALRHDITYRVKILDSETPNAFALPGGTIYVTKGMLNFVHSDDELAGVLGHEIGHVERYHSVKMYEEVRGANTLLTIGSVFSPLVSRFGDLAEGLFLLKVSRYHELAADQYGLALMNKAGYDPKAMPIFLRRLGDFFGAKHRALGKYFETHPGVADRIAHLAGYPELDRVDPERTLAAAMHDADEGRYGFALGRLDDALAAKPSLQAARARKRDDQTSLGKTIAVPAAPADPQLDRDAAAARATIAAQRATLEGRVKVGQDELRWVQYTLDSLEYDVGLDQTGGVAGVDAGSRLGELLRAQIVLTRNFDHAFNEALDTYAQAPPLLADALALVDEVIARRKAGRTQTSDGPIVAAARESALELLRAADAARSTIASAYAQRGAIEHYTRALDGIKKYPKGDLAQGDYDRLMPLLKTAQDASAVAFAAGSAASDVLNFAQARGTWAHIAALELDRAPETLKPYRHLLRAQFHAEPPAPIAADELEAPPADLAVATIVAAAGGQDAGLVLAQARRHSIDLVDYARERGIAGETLQLALGIVWTAYTDTGELTARREYR